MRVGVFLPLASYLNHVVVKPDPGMEIPNNRLLLRRGGEVCDEFRARARESGRGIKEWIVVSDNVAKEIFFWRRYTVGAPVCILSGEEGCWERVEPSFQHCGA